MHSTISVKKTQIFRPGIELGIFRLLRTESLKKFSMSPWILTNPIFLFFIPLKITPKGLNN